VALVASVVPLPATGVERLYSERLYSALQPRLTSVSNQLPFAALDILILTAGLLWLALAVRDFTRLHRLWGVARRAGVRTAVWAAGAYLAFLVLWGFNYRRVRLIEALPFDAARVTPDAVTGAARVAAGRVNALYEAGRGERAATGTGDPALAEAVQRVLADIGRDHRFVAARPKTTMLDWYFRRAGVDGMTDPFFLETLIASGVLPFERPFIVAHEWGHLAGIADEGEANFVGWLACLRASPAAQYSGWLFLYRELMPSVPERARASVASTLAPGPRADLLAIRARLVHDIDPRVSAVGWRVYDSYLKANRVEAGAASYAEVVQLVVGARLRSGWEPLSQP
jgi:hypothetical protein